jgi:ubiquinone/menaquinone biosynthesis C-methylase UbiE
MEFKSSARRIWWHRTGPRRACRTGIERSVLVDFQLNAPQLGTVMNTIGRIARARTKVSERKNVIREHADRIAADREAWVRKSSAYYGDDWRHMRFLIPVGARVLDIGSGTGDLLALLEPSVGVGVDLSPKMIDRARCKYPDLTFRVGDAEDDAFLATIEGPFDYIVLSDTIGLLDDIETALGYLHRLCTPETRRDRLLLTNLGTGAVGCSARQDADAAAPGQFHLQYGFS